MSPTPQGSETAEGNEMDLSELAEEEEQLLKQLQKLQGRKNRAVSAAAAGHGNEQTQELLTTPDKQPSQESKRRFDAVRTAQTARLLRESELRATRAQVGTGGSSSSGQGTQPVTLVSEARRERFVMPDLGQTVSGTDGSVRTPDHEDAGSITQEHPENRSETPEVNPVQQDEDDDIELVPEDGSRMSDRERVVEEDNQSSAQNSNG